MSRKANRIDALVAELASVRDDELIGEVRSSSATALLATIIESPIDLRERGRSGRRRVRTIAFIAAAAAAAVLSIPALSVVRQIAGLMSGADEITPLPTSPEIIVASGEVGVPWKLVAVTSDHGLCLGLYAQDPVEGWVGSAHCDYLDLRGDLPADVRGNQSRPCLASPTEVVPCGTLPRHWIDFPGGTADYSGYSALDRIIVFGPAAQGVASVDLVLGNGKNVHAQLVQEPEGLPLDFYWAELPFDADYRGPADERTEPVEIVVARDSSGDVLERRVPAWNGNPTGDPHGPAPPG